MLELKELLKDIGLVDKEAQVYSALLPLGSASVRTLAEKTGINRGTVHDSLLALEVKGLVLSERRGSKRRFLVRSPAEILQTLGNQKNKIEATEKKVKEALPTLLSFYAKEGGRPSVEYFDSDEGIRLILKDVLSTVSKLDQKEYVLYSSKSMRSYLYKLFPEFTREKIKLGIKTKVIARGAGGDPKNLGLAERKWLDSDAPAYILVYGPKVALISAAEDKTPFGVLIRDEKIAQTQKIIFDNLWAKI
ncbi:MAG: TrmB family transcriptional regulator [Candidatus Niyogibacteria bacterium]|nr:TrmB family transcriptional regulator [Candidatus Niyogibacteria bacterium]